MHYSYGPRASSKKTRIETSWCFKSHAGLGCPRASSKKTRIETLRQCRQRRGWLWSEGKFQENKDWNRKRSRTATWRKSVRGQVPRKQGLKLAYLNDNDMQSDCPRASSKKTRIETQALDRGWSPNVPSEGKFQENKDWNLAAIDDVRAYLERSEGKFQENKDWNW